MSDGPHEPPLDEAPDLEDADTDRDRGLAAERADLAWGRSTLSLFACGAAVAKGIPKITGDARPGPGVAVLVLGGAVWLAGIPFARVRANPGGRRAVARPAELAPLAFGTAVVGVAAFMLGLLFPG